MSIETEVVEASPDAEAGEAPEATAPEIADAATTEEEIATAEVEEEEKETAEPDADPAPEATTEETTAG